MVECGGLENRLRVLPVRGFESLLLRHHLFCQRVRVARFFVYRPGGTPKGVVALAGVLSGFAFRPVTQSLSERGTLLLGGSCGWLKLCLMMGVANETTAFIGIHFSHANGGD